MKEIKIEILYPAFFKLLLKDSGGIIGLHQLMSRVFIRKEEAITRVFIQDFAEHNLAQTAVVGICGVKVVDTLGYSTVDHSLCHCAVDGSVGGGGKSHGTEAKERDPLCTKISVYHKIS